MVMRIRKLMCAFLGAFAIVACTDNNISDEGVTVDNGKKAAVVSLYSNESCLEQDLLAGNVLVKEGASFKMDVNVPSYCQKVYMKYNATSGEQVRSLPLSTAAVSRATYAAADFDWATTRVASVTLTLPEDAVQPTSETDAGFLFYHNTGVAMFEDNWPIEEQKDNDLNDVVFEYDLKVTECQNEDLLGAQGYKEGLLLTLDVRAKGGRFPIRLGVELLGLDTKFIENIETRILLKKGQGMMDELATGTTDVTVRTPLFGREEQYCRVDVDTKNGNPIITMDGLADLGNNETFFQTTEGFVTEGQGMLRAEIKLSGKLRSEMTAAEGQAQLEAFRNLILDTKTQNFFIVTQQNGKNRWTHMKGYEPVYTYTTYEEDSEGEMSDVSYCNKNGFVWGIKVPAGVQHAYEKVHIYEAYPEFEEWVKSNGTKNLDWYLHPADGKIVKYW